MAEKYPEEVVKLNKKYGDRFIYRLDDSNILPVDTIPSGSLELDLALGVGGLPLGRIIEIYGGESGGKTTLCQHIVAEAQKLGHPTGYFDMEHAVDPSYAARCGVKFSGENGVFFSQPDTGEEALEGVDTLVHSGKPYVIIVDSVAALVPRAEIEGEMGDAHMGLQARLMSQALRKLSGAVKSSNSMVVFTNQLRMKLGLVFGNPETTTGGNALKFYASVRLDVRRKGILKSDDGASGIEVKVRVTKNKVAPPLREAEFDIEFGHGISKEGELIDMGSVRDIITKRGAFYSLGDIKLGQGRNNAVKYLKDNPDLASSIEATIRESFKSVPMAVASEDTEDGQEEEL